MTVIRKEIRPQSRHIEGIIGLADSKTEQARREPNLSALIKQSMLAGRQAYYNSDRFKDVVTTPGLDEGMVRKAVDRFNYSGTKPYTTENNTLIKAVSESQEEGRKVIEEALTGIEPSISSIILKYGLDLCAKTDKLRTRFVEEVINNPLELQVLEEHGWETEAAINALIDRSDMPENSKEQAKKLDHLYVTFQKAKDGSIKAVPLSEIFVEEYREISDSYKGIIDELNVYKQDKDEIESMKTQAFIDCFQKLLIAQNCKSNDPIEQDDNYKTFDLAWLKAVSLSPETYIRPPFETYLDRFGKRRDPEFMVGAEDKQEGTLDQTAEIAKMSMIETFEKQFPEGKTGHESMKPFLDLMRQTNIVYITAIVGGTKIIQRPIASNLPNDPGPKEKVGRAHITIFPEIYDLRRTDALETIEKVFGKNSLEVNDYEKYKDQYKKYELMFTSLHEVFHNAFMTPNSRETDIRDHIETKADMGAIAFSENVLKAVESEDYQEGLIRYCKNICFRSLRNLIIKGNETVALPYVYGSIMYLNFMTDLKMLVRGEDDRWKLDFTPENVSEFFSKTSGVVDEFAKLYETRDKQAESIINNLYQRNAMVESISKEFALNGNN